MPIDDFIQPTRPGAVDKTAGTPSGFPDFAFEHDGTEDQANPTLTLVDPWNLGIEGDLDIGGDLNIVGKASLGVGGYNTGYHWENGKHQINANDGGGNINRRFANDFSTGCTEVGYAFHEKYTQSTGLLEYKSSTASLSVGDTPSWKTGLSLYADGHASISEGITVPVLHVQDQKASGVVGGTFTSGAWRTRVLNTTLINTITGASLSGNQITLPAGTYKITASAPAIDVSRHMARLYNITNAALEILGTSEYSNNVSTYATTRSFICGTFTIAGIKVFELQHRCQVTSGTTIGLGVASGTGFVVDHETYADVFIEKIG